MKRVLASFLAIVMCLGMLNVFAAGKQFKDVKSSDWFYNDVQSAVELGLVNGKTETTYEPKANLTYAEAIKLAACMHQLYTTGIISFESGTPWYMPYVEYCQKNSIITKDYNYAENATRAGYMGIFAKALPGDGLKAINSVADNSIPDVPSSKDYAAGVYKLYRAGILQGVDDKHNCSPLNNITRAEVAAILTRMMNPEKRVKFTLEKTGEIIECVSQPIGGAIEVGGTIAASAGFKGGSSTTYTYQWEYNNGSGWKNVTSALGKVSGETSVRVSIKSEIPTSYKVRCVATDSNGNKGMSDEITFTFNAALHIAQQPTDAGTTVGKPTFVTVKAAGGTPPYKYEWACKVPNENGYTSYSLIGAMGVSGADTDTMIYVPSAPTTSDVYCIITDALGKKVTSDTVTLVSRAATGEEPKVEEPKVEEEEEPPFKLVKKPQDVTVATNEPATFEVQSEGGVAPYAYQWFYDKDGSWVPFEDSSEVKGATTPKMTITKNSATTLKIRCRLSESGKKKTRINTPAVTLTVEDKNQLKISTQPVTTTVKVGEDAKLSVKTEGGSGNFTYKWQWDMSEKGGWIAMTENAVWLGTTTPDLTVKSNSPANLLIRCVIVDNATNAKLETESVRVIFE